MSDAGSGRPENLHGTTTSPPGATPVVLPRLFVGNAAGLGFSPGIVVLPRFAAGTVAPIKESRGPRAAETALPT